MPNYTKRLKERLIRNAVNYYMRSPNITGALSKKKSAFIFDDISMSFHPASWNSIMQNTNWKQRTQKVHPHLAPTCEMQSSNSSDALLMNAFCHPDITAWKGIWNILNINASSNIAFGYPVTMAGHNTQIDMMINDHIFEAKLTESDFKKQDVSTVSNYPNFHKIFDQNLLTIVKSQVSNYQLIRNIIAAGNNGWYFTLIVDETRIDLIHEFYNTVIAVKDPSLRKRLSFVTWQGIVDHVGRSLKSFIKRKYF